MNWISQTNVKLETPAFSRLLRWVLQPSDLVGRPIAVHWRDSAGFAIAVRQKESPGQLTAGISVPRDFRIADLID